MRENNDYVIAAEFQALKLCVDNTIENIKDVEPTMFPHPTAKAIFQAIHILKDRNEPITELSLLREANQLNELVDTGIVQRVLKAEAKLESKEAILSALRDENTKTKINELVEKIKDQTTAVDQLDPLAVSNLVYQTQEVLAKSGNQSCSKTLEQCFDEYKDVLKLRKKGKYNLFGDTFLDKHLRRKAAPGQFILVAGATGTGKSTYGLYVLNGMINLGIPCLYISLEMDTESTMDRLVAMRSGIPLEEWYSEGARIDPLIERIDQEKELLKDKPFRLVDEGSLGIDQIQHYIREFKLTYKTDYVCVVIDLITQVKEFIDMGKTKGNLATTIEVAVNKLHSMVKREKVCCLGLAQMNRDTDSEKIKSIEELERLRPTINNVKNSGALGERSRVVISVFRPKYYAVRLFPDNQEAQVMEDELQVQILKQSQGSVGTIGRYIFTGESFSIVPLIEPPKEDVGITY